jgi:hypothetical protein
MKINIVPPTSNYKWAKNFKRIQDRFYNDVKLRRIQEIEDFIKLNNYKNVNHIEDVRLDMDLPHDSNFEYDLTLVTHQGYSRYPLTGIIDQIHEWTTSGDLYLCLNRHYLNIDNQAVTIGLDDDFQIAITQWLDQSIPNTVLDLSRDYLDYGKHFTWSCPDRHYWIKKL